MYTLHPYTNVGQQRQDFCRVVKIPDAEPTGLVSTVSLP